jgi:hypothetical protein
VTALWVNRHRQESLCFLFKMTISFIGLFFTAYSPTYQLWRVEIYFYHCHGSSSEWLFLMRWFSNWENGAITENLSAALKSGRQVSRIESENAIVVVSFRLRISIGPITSGTL